MAKKETRADLPEHDIRLERLQALRDAGITPFPSRVRRSHAAAQARLLKQGDRAAIAGRVISRRVLGKIAFATVKDESGTLQVVLSEDRVGKDRFRHFAELYDIGDFMAAQGEMMTTRAGEFSLGVTDFQMAAKSLLPLPEKWHGLQDVEARFRKRYLDLIMNDEVRERMLLRSRVIASMRRHMDGLGFVEVETPTLQPIYGGGFARPFITHHNSLDADFYLRISDELYLKRLLVGGMEKVYEITKVFRNEGIDRDHNPEFTMFEAQVAYQDYAYGMELFEELVESVVTDALGSDTVELGSDKISFERPWKRLSMLQAVETLGQVKASAWKTADQAKKELRPLIAKSKHDELDRMASVGEALSLAFEELVEHQLIQPTIVYDYPKEISPLAKESKDNPGYVEQFEVFIRGMEIGNNYSELNDPLELERRFIAEKKKEEAGFDEAHQDDTDFIEAVKHGMPPSVGLGIGVDRMIMVLTGAETIKEVMLFPALRPKNRGDHDES